MKVERTEVEPPKDHPCAACPWLTSNHRRPHPDGWYTDANRRRLWNGLRTGEAPGMTCHPTDPHNQPVGDDTTTRECAGAWILIARETEAFKAVMNLPKYRRGRKLAMSRDGLIETQMSLMPRPLGRGLGGMRIDLGSPVSIGLGTDR